MTGQGDGEPIRRLLQYLSHEQTRSGASIAEALGYSRTALWKHVESLRAMGVLVDAVAGQGYRLREPLELLDKAAIRSHLGEKSGELLKGLHILSEVDSTNRWLQDRESEAQHACAVFAEQQKAGKGRRGRSWVSPFGRNLYLSLGWRFESGVAELACLPLVVAIAACDALESAGVTGVNIKWPNDLLLDGAKLGGCLVEAQGDAAGPCLAIIGIGVNVRMRAELAGDIDQPWTDVASTHPEISRNHLAGALLDALLLGIAKYSDHGFAAFRDSWERRDALKGKAVVVNRAGRNHEGTAAGIGSSGGLLLQSPAGIAEYTAGEVSIRQKDL